jgi:NADH-quinone oxidoreductase subunit A
MDQNGIKIALPAGGSRVFQQQKIAGGVEVSPVTEQSVPLWPVLVYFVLVLALVASMIVLSSWLGQRHQDRATGEPYESGMVSTGSARLRLSANFYLIAMLFVVFDVEAVFIIAWALVVRDVGWSGYIGVVIFIGILGLALLYEWRQGALDWVTPLRRRRARPVLSASANPHVDGARNR